MQAFLLIRKVHLSLSCNEDKYSLDTEKVHIILSHFTGVGTQAAERPILYSKPSERSVIALPVPNVSNTERWTT